MKKVLIITDLYYASPRIPGLCKYLAEFGWSATILTTTISKKPRERLVLPNGYAQIIEIPCRNIAQFCKGLIGLKRDDSILARLGSGNFSKNKSLIDSVLFHLFIWGGTLIAYPDEMRSWRIPALKKAKELIQLEIFDAILSSSFPVTSHRIANELARNNHIPWLADLRDLWTQNHNYLYPWRRFFETRLEKKDPISG